MRERPDDPGHATAVMFPDSFAEMFPDIEMPEVIGVPCCSQFALSREKVHERPIGDYIRVRQWLLDSPLDASITGRIFEYSWHSKLTFFRSPLRSHAMAMTMAPIFTLTFAFHFSDGIDAN